MKLVSHMQKTGTFKDLLVPIAKEGYPFIAIFFLISILSYFIWSYLLIPTLILTLWCVYFFRDPERVTPLSESHIISPADGVVSDITPSSLPAELQHETEQTTEQAWQRISVFMNVFNVHVNRMPIDCRVKANHYFAGEFLNASLDKASELNERQSLLLELNNGQEIAMVQIAGLVARRIICHAHTNTYWQQGQRFGMIRFGSRVDVYVPSDSNIKVSVGQTMIAGETILAEYNEHHDDDTDE